MIYDATSLRRIPAVFRDVKLWVLGDGNTSICLKCVLQLNIPRVVMWHHWLHFLAKNNFCQLVTFTFSSSGCQTGKQVLVTDYVVSIHFIHFPINFNCFIVFFLPTKSYHYSHVTTRGIFNWSSHFKCLLWNNGEWHIPPTSMEECHLRGGTRRHQDCHASPT